jgi:CheY-like chemotaxis protein
MPMTDASDDLGKLLADAAASVAGKAEPSSTKGAGGPSSPPVHRRGCDVLMADDSGPSREILSAILRNFASGLRLHEVRNGTDAVQAWRALQPHVTMLDLDMPGLDGFAALQQIREIDASAFVAIVSAGSSVDNVRKALSLGAGGFVVKPYKPQRILDVLKKYAVTSGHPLLG